MRIGIAHKIRITYLIIILAAVFSGFFCFYVLKKNRKANFEMRYVTLPSIENLEVLKLLNLEINKLTANWIYIPNKKEQERLLHITNDEYKHLSAKIDSNARNWKDEQELQLYNQIVSNNKKIIYRVNNITSLLNSPESYANDLLADKSDQLYSLVVKEIGANDKLLAKLIDTKNNNLELQQNSITSLLVYLYITVLITVLIILSISLLSMRLAKQSFVEPLLKLKEIVLRLTVGEVKAINEIKRTDEIGQMHNAISKMIGSILQKINFAAQIGKGNYDAEFNLLSVDDQLGMALQTMRNDLKTTNQALIEQDKRLLNAQKLARVGNYLYDINKGVFQSSKTVDDVLGIDDTFEKTNLNWKSLIVDEFQQIVAEKGMIAIRDKIRFEEIYKILRYNDKMERWVKVIGEYNFDSNGIPITMFGTLQDITESKNLEVDLNNSYHIATEQNKRLLNFSYIVSHNLRMHSVNIHSLLNLLDESQAEEDRQYVLKLLRNASELLDETMHHLNDVVAMQNALNVEITPQSLNRHISQAIDVLTTQIASKNAKIINNVKGEIIINYNPAYLGSIVLNFISNAIKYSKDDRQPEITIDCYKENEHNEHSKWILQIADNGIGIDLKRHGHKLFGMYKTFHGNKDAKGIGLFLTKYQVEAMGGSIEVESELNKGTTFKIYMK